MEELPRTGVPRSDMLKRVAFFKDLKGSDGGLPGPLATLLDVMVGYDAEDPLTAYGYGRTPASYQAAAIECL